MQQSKLEKAEDVKKKYQSDLKKKILESNKLKDTVNLLQEKLEKAEHEYFRHCKAAKNEKDKLLESSKFLGESVKRSTEETLTMERKYNDSKRALKKKEAENSVLKEKLGVLEQANTKLINNNVEISKNPARETQFSETPADKKT